MGFHSSRETEDDTLLVWRHTGSCPFVRDSNLVSFLGSVCFLGLISLFCVMGTYHRPLIVLLLPVNMTRPLYRTSTPTPHLSKMTSQPTLHSRTIDNRECFIPGITCAFLAASGNHGTSSIPSCVLLAFSPFATVTTIGFAVVLLRISGASTCRK